MQRIMEAKPVLTMKVDSTFEWNRILLNNCSCTDPCLMPECASPFPNTARRIYARASPMRFQNGGVWYRTRRYSFSDGGFDQTTHTGTYFGRVGSKPAYYEDTTYEDQNTEGDPKTGSISTEYLDAVDAEQAAQDAEAWLRSRTLDWVNQSEDNFFGYPKSEKHLNVGGNLVTLYFGRFRWFRAIDPRNPAFYQVVWDVRESPHGGSPFLHQQDQSFTWNMPRDGNDDLTIFSDWVHLDPPTDPGIREIVNVRAYCYNSAKFGRKPKRD